MSLWGDAFGPDPFVGGHTCGTGGWTGPKPGDPDNNSLLSAVPAFGGIDVSWTFPTTNPAAVAHTLLYRGITNIFANALQLAVVAGNFFYDKSTVSTPVTYYYWIQIVSVNGTVGETIGPASAMARPTIADMIEQLTGKIDAGLLATSLKTDIADINVVGNALLEEVKDRIAANTALSLGLQQAQIGVDAATATVQQEIIKRIEADSALVVKLNEMSVAVRNSYAAIFEEQRVRVTEDSALATQLTTLAAAVQSNVAAIFQEATTRANADSSLASQLTVLSSQTVANAATATQAAQLNEAAIKEEVRVRTTQDTALATDITTLFAKTAQASAGISTIETAKIGYAAKQGTNVPYDGDGLTVVYPVSSFPASTFPDYAYNRTKIIDREGVNRWNNSSAGSANPLVWVAGLPLATAIKTIGVTGPNGEGASLESAFLAQKDLNGNFKGMYTAKVSVTQDGTKIIGGFGLYGDATGIEAGFDVDRFWVGRSAVNPTTGKVTQVKPFIIEGTEVYINDAVINKLTFNKLRSDDGSLVFENGKLKANYLKVTEIMGGDFTGFTWPAAGQQGFYLGPGGFGMGNYNALPGRQAQFVYMSADGTFVVPGMRVQNGVMTIEQIDVIDTLNIKGNAVTVPLYGGKSSNLDFGSTGVPNAYTASQYLKAGASIMAIATFTVLRPGFHAVAIDLRVLWGGAGTQSIANYSFSYENYGSGAASGFFTAPVDGYYHLRAHVAGSDGPCNEVTNCSISAFGAKR